jgi:D-lactate dehydrogenase
MNCSPAPATRPRLPKGFDKLCCGQMLASKGMAEEADGMSDDAGSSADESLRERPLPGHHGCQRLHDPHAEAPGRPPETLRFPRIRPRRPAAAPDDHQAARPGRLHVNCSVRKTGSDGKLKALLAACVEKIIEPAGVTCCGFAGDRGFVVPELNQHALRKIHDELPPTAPAAYRPTAPAKSA